MIRQDHSSALRNNLTYGPHMRNAQSCSRAVTVAAFLLSSACDKNMPTRPDAESRRLITKLMTAADSAAFFESRKTASGSITTIAGQTLIPVKAADTIVVHVDSNECSGNPETVRVYGVINQTIVAGSCDGGLMGTTVTLPPPATDGSIYFTATHQEFGEGPAGQVSGEPPSYTVGLDDGAGDLDYNDVILTVTITGVPRLSCTPSPTTRGSRVSCTASGGGLQVSRWRFTGPDYVNAGVLLVEGPPQGNTWAGTAVASGTVIADMIINGTPSPDSLTATFTVTARTTPEWQFRGQAWSYVSGSAISCGSGLFLYVESTIMGWNTRKGTCSGKPITPVPEESPNGGYTVGVVTSGPNTGISYVTAMTYRMDTESGINDALKAGSGTVWQLVNRTEKNDCKKGFGSAVTSVNFYNFNSKCRNIPDTVIAFQAGLLNHEGYGKSSNSGHQAQLEMEAAKPQNNIYQLAEAVFAQSESSTRAAVEVRATEADRRLRPVWASHTYVLNNWCGSLWRWNTASNIWVRSVIYQTGGVCI